MNEDDLVLYIVKLIGRPLTIEEMLDLRKTIYGFVESNQYA
jgi:hypothetical protein